MKKVIAIIISIAALAMGSVAFAEATPTLFSEGGNQQGQRQERKDMRSGIRQERQDMRQNRVESLEQKKQFAQDRLENKKQLMLQFKEKLTAERCAKVEEKMAERTAKFEAAKEKHATVYQNLLARIDKFITRFTEFDKANPGKIDAAKLAKIKTDRATLETMITDFKTQFASYFTQLGGAKKLTCGASEGEFRGSLLDARASLVEVRAQAAAIRTFVRETVIPDLLAVKKEIAAAKGEQIGTETSEAKDDDKTTTTTEGSDTTDGATDNVQ
jgi:hypothetical protein